MQENVNRNIYTTFEKVAARRSAATAVIYLGTRFSYNRVKDLSERFAAALNDLGVAPREKVIIYLPNSIQWVVAWLGILRAGAVCVPITPIYTPHDLNYIATDCNAETIICADANYGYVQSVMSSTNLKRIIVARMTGLLPWWKRYFGTLFDVTPTGKVARDEKTHSIRDLLAKYKDSRSPPNPTGRTGHGRDSLHGRDNQIPQRRPHYP